LEKIYPLKGRSLFLKVAQALPQKRKMDDLVEKAEELAVQELWVLETRRGVVKMGKEAQERARNRWERIVIEAAKQSGSPVLTKVGGPISFEKVVTEKLEVSDRAFLFHPDPAGLPFGEMVKEMERQGEEERTSPVFLFFGPEGGFTEEEVQLAESFGVRKVFLGDSVLRIETAFLGVVSAIRFLLS
jgi:16S rRNA (uracil1498-N3)-methyltransferase